MSLGGHAQTIGEAGKEPVTVIKPKKEVEDIHIAAIDTERFEVGAYVGLMSIADFNTVSVSGISASYHIHSKWAIVGLYGRSGDARASFEGEVGGSFVPKDERSFRYIALLGAYEFNRGRSFIGRKFKMNTHLYADFGLEKVSFATESPTGIVFGARYKLVITDWLTADLGMHDHFVKREFLGESKNTHNLELTLGVQGLF